MATLVARYFRGTSQLQSMQGFGMQRTHKNIYIQAQEREMGCMATLVARCC